jgi:alpha-glucuronidase
VKANSEGQPGPQDYKRSHADGANMLADALQSHGGVVMWRAFVYSNDVPVDRIRQAYDEFKPLDGTFRENVLIQVKNGPLDFQPREPFHPLFGAMPKTPLMMEFQVTKEYLGQDTHLVFLAPTSRKCSTPTRGRTAPVRPCARASTARCIDRRDGNRRRCEHRFRPQLDGLDLQSGQLVCVWSAGVGSSAPSSTIADDWIRMTLTSDAGAVSSVRSMMLKSREAVVNYMTPLGLAHIMATGHHYGPGPWADGGRADWTPSYYHRADTLGIGFDRTAKGSNAAASTSLRRETIRRSHDGAGLTLLWFHHVGWTERMRSGRTLWDELALHYQAGVDSVRSMQRTWRGLAGSHRLRALQRRGLTCCASRKVRRVGGATPRCRTSEIFSHLPLPKGVEPPAHPLSFYRQLRCPPNRDKPRCVVLDAKP